MVDIGEGSLLQVPEETAPGHPDPASISPDAWRRFEGATLAVVTKIQPTVSSERLRFAVINYLQRLFRFHAGCQVFPFGSVPLKTYLPDGDIDLTAFGGTAFSDERLANEVHAILESEERRKDSEFEVKDVQCINAEVKLVKCLVQNIVVDISFNQIGGLCTLCFLEKVDQNFGKDHLFKRSIMLIKDWCYYESRILGAHHGLLSTYALETLVLYIFHTFHQSLDGPLAVLYRFLDYYSKFDWDNKGISLFGPVSLSSLPELVIDQPDTHDDGFVPREEFLKECVEAFSVPTKNSEKNGRVFFRKFLNIVDPLKQGNNLGRSVSKGNFYRIRSAFDFGARKLGKILQVPACSTVNEVNQFFRNTLKRNRIGSRPDILVISNDDLMMDHVTNDSMSLGSDVEMAKKGSLPSYSSFGGDLSNQFSDLSISDSSNHELIKQKECNSLAEHKEVKSVSGGLVERDVRSSAATNLLSMRNGSDFHEASPAAAESYALPCAPHQFYQSGNGKKVDVGEEPKPSRHSSEDAKYENEFSGSSVSLFGQNGYSSAGVDDVSATYNSNFTVRNSEHGGITNDAVSDLTGDFNTSLNNLLYAQFCQQDNPANQFYYPVFPAPPAQFWNAHPSTNGNGRKNPYGYAGMNGAIPGCPPPPGYVMFRPLYPDEQLAARARGTGTYFPDPNWRKGPAAGRGQRGRHHFPANNYQKFHHYAMDMPAGVIPSEELQHELPMQIYVPGVNDHGSPLPTPTPPPSAQTPRDPLKVPTYSPSYRVRRDTSHGDGYMLSQDGKSEFGTSRAFPLEVTSKDHASRIDSGSNNQASAPVSAVKNTGMASNRVRNAQPYHLKDSGDFPPLSN